MNTRVDKSNFGSEESKFFVTIVDCGCLDSNAEILLDYLNDSFDCMLYIGDKDLKSVFEYLKEKCLEIGEKAGKNKLCLDKHQGKDLYGYPCGQIEIFEYKEQEKEVVCVINFYPINGTVRIVTANEKGGSL